MVQGATLMNNSGVGNITWFPEIKISGTYYRLNANQTTANGSVAQSISLAYIAEANEIVSVNTATNNGAAVTFQVVEFDNTVSVYSQKLTSLSAGDNAVYTVPAGVTALILSSTLVSAGTGTLMYLNTSGGARTIQWKLTPSGGSLTAISASSPMITDLARSAISFEGGLGAGDRLTLNTDVNTATQMAWVNVMEIA